MKAFILAAGMGTRLKPFTDQHPKALAKVNGKTLLELNIQFLQSFGITDVVVNIFHFADQIIQCVKENNGFGSKVTLSDERPDVLETGGGLKNAIPLLKNSEDILVMNVDILCRFDLNQLLEQHQDRRALATLAVQDRPSSRGFLFNREGYLCGWENFKTQEKKIPSNKPLSELTPLAFSGIQIIRRDFLSKIHQTGKFSIVETYLDLCRDEAIMAWNHSGDLWLDVGKPDTLEKAQELF